MQPRNVACSAAVLILTVIAAPDATGQSPGAAIQAAFKSEIGRWCWSRLTQSDTVLATFPGVRFVQAKCRNEHEEALSSIVGLDADSVLYLLTSRSAFNFLVTRHPPGTLKQEATVLAYAQTALVLAGYAMPTDRLVVAWTDVPLAARDSARKVAVRPVQVVETGNIWRLRLFLRSETAWGPAIRCYDVAVESSGRMWSAEKVWKWQAGYGP